MVDLTIGQVAAIIAFGIVIARAWCPTIGTFILAGQLRDRETAATWTVAAKHLQSSYWPLVLRSDAIKDHGVRKPVVLVSLLLPLLSFLIAIVGVVTPLGLYESNELRSKAVKADFEYMRDSSTFYTSMTTRDDKPFTRVCSLDGCYVPCPYTSDVTVIETDGLSSNCSLLGTIDPAVPDILREIYTSGTRYERTTISNYFDIEWRQTTTQYDRQLNNGTPIASGIYRRLETISLLDDARAVEGVRDVVVVACDNHYLVVYCNVEFTDQVILHPITQALQLLDGIGRESCPVPGNCPPCTREYPFWVRGYSILCSSRHHHSSGVFVVICLGGELTNFSNSSSSPGSSKTLIDCLIRSYGVTSRRSLLNRAAESDESGRSLYFAQCRRAPAMAVCRHSSAQWRSSSSWYWLRNIDNGPSWLIAASSNLNHEFQRVILSIPSAFPAMSSHASLRTVELRMN
ncbi:Uncharacterized protein HZ326_31190, partial [Fusarium oxysporum f. sp. albedinis]